jgi:hypothetical protein
MDKFVKSLKSGSMVPSGLGDDERFVCERNRRCNLRRRAAAARRDARNRVVNAFPAQVEGDGAQTRYGGAPGAVHLADHECLHALGTVPSHSASSTPQERTSRTNEYWAYAITALAHACPPGPPAQRLLITLKC